MNVLSLFDGMSCAQIALRELGIKIDRYYASEINKHAVKQTQLNFPDTIQLGDVGVAVVVVGLHRADFQAPHGVGEGDSVITALFPCLESGGSGCGTCAAVGVDVDVLGHRSTTAPAEQTATVAVEGEQTESGSGYAEAETGAGYAFGSVVFLLVVVNVGFLLHDFLVCSFHNYEVFLIAEQHRSVLQKYKSGMDGLSSYFSVISELFPNCFASLA